MRRSGVIAAMLITVAAASTACGAGPSIRPDVAWCATIPVSPSTGPRRTRPRYPNFRCRRPNRHGGTARTRRSPRSTHRPVPRVSFSSARRSSPRSMRPATWRALPLAVMRARLPDTPTDVAPLVLTTGADIASTRALTGMATGPMSGALTMRPIIAVDRRGIGNSLAIDCIFPADRRGLGDLGQFGRTGDAPERVADLAVRRPSRAPTTCSRSS